MLLLQLCVSDPLWFKLSNLFLSLFSLNYEIVFEEVVMLAGSTENVALVTLTLTLFNISIWSSNSSCCCSLRRSYLVVKMVYVTLIFVFEWRWVPLTVVRANWEFYTQLLPQGSDENHILNKWIGTEIHLGPPQFTVIVNLKYSSLANDNCQFYRQS